jgi:hypothetical protein
MRGDPNFYTHLGESWVSEREAIARLAAEEAERMERQIRAGATAAYEARPAIYKYPRHIYGMPATDFWIQLAIAVLSVAGAFLMTSLSPYAKWGFVLSLLSQPLYFVATWRARQPGMFLVAIFYTGAWVQGILNHF